MNSHRLGAHAGVAAEEPGQPQQHGTAHHVVGQGRAHPRGAADEDRPAGAPAGPPRQSGGSRGSPGRWSRRTRSRPGSGGRASPAGGPRRCAAARRRSQSALAHVRPGGSGRGRAGRGARGLARLNGSAASCPARARPRARRSDGLLRCRWWPEPRCHRRIRSSARSRPARRPATISPSSAWRLSSLSRPRSTCGRSAPNRPCRHWPQSSTTILSMIVVSDSSTALTVPYGTTRVPGPIQLVRSRACGSTSRVRLHDDVRPPNSLLGCGNHANGLAQRLAQRGAEGLA